MLALITLVVIGIPYLPEKKNRERAVFIKRSPHCPSPLGASAPCPHKAALSDSSYVQCSLTEPPLLEPQLPRPV